MKGLGAREGKLVRLVEVLRKLAAEE